MIRDNERVCFMPYKMFDVDGRKYVFTQDNAIYEIDDRTQQIIEKSGSTYNQIFDQVCHNFTKEEFEKLINDMETARFIVGNDNDTYLDMNGKFTLEGITLMLVQSCNMCCKYCYADEGVYSDEGKMDIETAKEGFEFLIKSSEAKELGVILFGGEPLLAFELIKELVVYMRKREQEIEKKIHISMTTNGTFINEEVEEFFDKYNVHMMISIDGDKETHDSNRYFKNKVGSYDMVLEKTQNLRDQGKLSARATISTGKQSLIKTFNHLEELGFKSVALSPAYNLFEESDYAEFAENQAEYIGEFLRSVNEHDYDRCRKMKVVYSRLKKINNYTGSNRAYSCGAGRTMLAVDIHGDLYPCHRFVCLKEFAVGNIRTGIYGQEKFLESIKINNKHEKCNSCWIKNMCVGDCPYTNFEATGDVSITDDRVCHIIQKAYEKFVEVYLQLSDEQKKELFEQ